MAPKAELLLRERLWLTDALRVELVVWLVPQPVRGSTHTFKYRLALVRDGQCALRYDNEAGKGDHKHVDEKEVPYDFVIPSHCSRISALTCKLGGTGHDNGDDRRVRSG